MRRRTVAERMDAWVDQEVGRYRALVTKHLSLHRKVINDLIEDPILTHRDCGARYGLTTSAVGEIVYRWRMRGIDIPRRGRGTNKQAPLTRRELHKLMDERLAARRSQ